MLVGWRAHTAVTTSRQKRTTLADFLREWLPGYASTVQETTAARNASLIRAQIIPRLGRTRLQDLRPRTLEQVYATLVTGDAAHRPVSMATVRSVHGAFPRALSDAERDERIGRIRLGPPEYPESATARARLRRGRPARRARSWRSCMVVDEHRLAVGVASGSPRSSRARQEGWHANGRLSSLRDA